MERNSFEYPCKQTTNSDRQTDFRDTIRLCWKVLKGYYICTPYMKQTLC